MMNDYILMNTQVEIAANYITNKVYPEDRDRDRAGMKLAVSRLLDILLLNTGIVLSTYCMSTSLSILSLIVTGSSGFFIYKIVRKIYIDIRTDAATGVTESTASDEFSKIMGAVGGSCWVYMAWVIRQLQALSSSHKD